MLGINFLDYIKSLGYFYMMLVVMIVMMVGCSDYGYSGENDGVVVVDWWQ